MPGAGLSLPDLAALGRFGGGGGGTPTPSPTPSLLAGFALNGSTNPALKAMLARVAAGTGEGVVVAKGDSLTAGTGAAVTANGQTAAFAEMLTGARPYRPTAVLAQLMTAVGVPTTDAGFVGDQGVGAGGLTLPAYDPRFNFAGGTIGFNADRTFAGGGILDLGGGALLDFAPGVPASRFEAVFYNIGGSVSVAVDGAVPLTTTAPGASVAGNSVDLPNASGFTKVTFTAAAGLHSARVAAGSRALLRSLVAYTPNSCRILNHSACSATSGEQAAKSGSAWLNGDALRFDAPDLTIVELGINDAFQGVPVATFQTNLAQVVADAKNSGDVLVLWANAANPAVTPLAAQDAMRDACAATAAAAGVAFGDIREAMGDWPSTAARTADNSVHPNRGYHADIAAWQWACLQAMAA